MPSATPAINASGHLYVAGPSSITSPEPGALSVYGLPLTSTSVPQITLNVSGLNPAVSLNAASQILAISSLVQTSSLSYTTTISLYHLPITSTSTPYATLVNTPTPTSQRNAVAIDDSGDVFLVSGYNPSQISIYSAPVTTGSLPRIIPLQSVLAGDPGAEATEYDALVVAPGGNLLAAEWSSGNLAILAPPYTGPVSYTSSAPASTSDSTESIAATGSAVFVALYCDDKIYAYPLPISASSAPSYTIRGADGPFALATDVNGNLYVARSTQIGYFSAPNLVDIYVPGLGEAAYVTTVPLPPFGNFVAGP